MPMMVVANIREDEEDEDAVRPRGRTRVRGVFPTGVVPSSVYATEDEQHSPAIPPKRRRIAPGQQISPVTSAVGAVRYVEREIAPGLIIRVRKGQQWSAERLDTGQFLLSPMPNQPRRSRSGEIGSGALLRDSDGYAQEIHDPAGPPAGRGSRW